MHIEKITYKSEARLRIDMPYNDEIARTLRQIQGAQWSQSLGAWHIADTPANLNQLKALFTDIQQKGNIGATNSSKFSMHITDKRIQLKIPKNQKDIEYILRFRYSRWDAKNYVWLVPNFKDNATQLKAYFADRHIEITENTSVVDTVQQYRATTEIIAINTANKTLRLIFSYNKALVQLVKQFPYAQWHKDNKWWTIPYADKFKDQLAAFCTANALKFIYKVEEGNKIQAKKSKYDTPNYRTCPDEYTQKLIELRYSEQTVKTYASMFKEFINYYHECDINKIDEKMIKAFLRYLVTERKISISYQNQSINAIKFYYERVLGGQRIVYDIDRPRKEKTLPTVLSEQEVVDILRHVKNIKHKAILMTIYSAGLRISELIKLKISDIDSERMQIYVQQSKGKKDRFTVLSTKALDILRLYFIEYKPQVYLFEGQKGGQYSKRSIQNILMAAVAKTNITKHVTVHTLRHSFATHLLENGTDIRYIQSLLGHSSSTTTDIYTHITTKGFDQIKSPLDHLDIL